MDSSPSAKYHLLTVAKRPQPGKTKTRLCPPLNAAQASALYECFLLDTLDLMRSLPGVRCTLAFVPAEAYGYFSSLAPDMDLVTQRGATLGDRLDALLRHALAEGAAKAVVMNSDSPTLPAAYLVQAFQALDTADVVLGPADDGGYYLIGVKKPQPGLLRPVRMSTPQVLQDTLNLAQGAGLTTALLPSWFDIDAPQDLERLRRELLASDGGPGAHTRRWLIESGLPPG
jgi:rSAM/selenodomain-associated transferase 1